MTTIALTLAPPRSRAGARLGFQIVCAVAGSFFLAGLAQISIPLGFTPVPITGQTLGMLLVGAAYGPALGASTVILYLAWAVVGLPVLAPTRTARMPWTGRAQSHLGDGWLPVGIRPGVRPRGVALAPWMDRTFRSSIGAMFLGSVVIYAVALPWLHRVLAVGWEETFAAGLYPFIIGDTLKLLAAAGLLPAAWALLKRLRPREEG